MARRLREDFAGNVVHVYNRGGCRRVIFKDDLDRVTYLAILGRVAKRCGWRVLGYCLMDNHMHLVIETPEANLAYGMQRLHGTYVQTFNARHGEDGPLFKGRYKSKRVRDDAQLCTVVRYVVRNPVEARMHPRPGGYPWSSHDAIASDGAPEWLDRDRLLELFSGNGGDPLARYLKFVEGSAPIDEGAAPQSEDADATAARVRAGPGP
jgi:REP element-mobilizing transposase RayT